MAESIGPPRISSAWPQERIRELNSSVKEEHPITKLTVFRHVGYKLRKSPAESPFLLVDVALVADAREVNGIPSYQPRNHTSSNPEPEWFAGGWDLGQEKVRRGVVAIAWSAINNQEQDEFPDDEEPN